LGNNGRRQYLHCTPLWVACYKGNQEAVELLLTYDIDPLPKGQTKKLISRTWAEEAPLTTAAEIAKKQGFNRISLLVQQKVGDITSTTPIFQNSSSIKKPPRTIPKTARPELVAEWISGLPLSSDYSEVIKKNAISGAALATMGDKYSWNELGITNFGDIRVLISETAKLFKLQSDAQDEIIVIEELSS
jgi:hypothetical protein